eukprot:5164521-Pyramimonas_sp.AAC.1
MQRCTVSGRIPGLLRARQNCEKMSSQALRTCCFGLQRRRGATAPFFATPPAAAAKPGDRPLFLERALAAAQGRGPPDPCVRRSWIIRAHLRSPFQAKPSLPPLWLPGKRPATYKAFFARPPRALPATAVPRQGRREAVDCATSF